MPQVWTPDDLAFADVRAAHFEAAGQVAADLLAAAGQPRSRLKGVTVAEASLRAASLLVAAGERDRAAAIARRVLGDVRGRPDELAAACLLAQTGDQAAAEALVVPALRALQDRPGQVVIMEAVALALGLANGEQFELAERVADETATAYGCWKAGPGRRDDRNGTLGNVVGLARQTILTAHQDLQDFLTGQRPDKPGMQPSALAPWPAPFGSCLLWWPEAEYQRIVRQVPDVRTVLGATWRDHTAKVESAMLALASTAPVSRPGGATGYTLAPADFEHFCGYLGLARADPRLATTMTGFTAHYIGLAESDPDDIRQPVPWPPAERSRCWCGSNAPYRRCCQLPG